MSIAYQNYLNTEQRITAIERQFRAYYNLELPIASDVFEPHPGPARAQAKLDMLITIIARQKPYILSLAEQWFSSI